MGIEIGTAAIIASIVSAASTAASVGYQMSQGSPTAPSQSQLATEQANASAAAAQAQAEALTKRRGMASTILTSPVGAGAASIGKATLG